MLTLQNYVHFRYAILKYNTGADIEEVVRLDVLTMFKFTPYYDPSTPLWEVVANSMSYFWQFCNHKKGCISVAVRSLLLD